MGTMKLDSGPLPVLLCPPYWSSDRLWPDRKFSENSNFEDHITSLRTSVPGGCLGSGGSG